MTLILLNRIVKGVKAVPNFSQQTASVHYRDLIGKREIVGFGFNGQPSYADRGEFPFPAIRWREPSAEIDELRNKEKEDWHKLSLCEKKSLYRSSFCQTYAEFTAPSGEWKSVLGVGFVFIALSLWFFYWQKTFIDDPLPISFDEDHRRAQFRRMIDIRANAVTGLGSKWDYDRDDWKK